MQVPTTPYFLILSDKMEQNCQEMRSRIQKMKGSLRAMVKTHKTFQGTLMCLFGCTTVDQLYKTKQHLENQNEQLDPSFQNRPFTGKVACSTFSEVEMIVDKAEEHSDILQFDVLYTSPLVITRFEAMHRLTQRLASSQQTITVMIDCPQTLDQLLHFSQKTNSKWNLFFKVFHSIPNSQNVPARFLNLLPLAYSILFYKKKKDQCRIWKSRD